MCVEEIHPHISVLFYFCQHSFNHHDWNFGFLFDQRCTSAYIESGVCTVPFLVLLREPILQPQYNNLEAYIYLVTEKNVVQVQPVLAGLGCLHSELTLYTFYP